MEELRNVELPVSATEHHLLPSAKDVVQEVISCFVEERKSTTSLFPFGNWWLPVDNLHVNFSSLHLYHHPSFHNLNHIIQESH